MLVGNSIRTCFLFKKSKTEDVASATPSEDNHRGPLSISKGVLISVVLGLGMWAVIFAIIHAIKSHLH